MPRSLTRPVPLQTALHRRAEPRTGQHDGAVEADPVGRRPGAEVERHSLLLVGAEIAAELGAQLHEHHSEPFDRRLEVAAAAEEPRRSELLGFAEDLSAEQHRRLGVHPHRERVPAVDAAVPGGDVQTAPRVVADAVAPPSADADADEWLGRRLQRRRQQPSDRHGVGQELHRQTLATDEARLCEQLLDLADLLGGPRRSPCVAPPLAAADTESDCRPYVSQSPASRTRTLPTLRPARRSISARGAWSMPS